MLIFFIYSAPCLICIIWLLILLAMGGKNVSQRLLTLMMGMMAVYTYIEAHYLLIESNYLWLAYMDYFAQILTLSLFPIFTIYLRSLVGIKSNKYVVATMFFPALIMAIANGLIYAAMGVKKVAKYRLAYNVLGGHPESATDDIYKLYDLVTIDIFAGLQVLWVVIILVFLAIILKRNEFMLKDLFLFVFKKRSSSSVNVICILSFCLLLLAGVRIGLGRVFLIKHHWISAMFTIAMSIIIYIYGYIAAVFAGTKVTFKDLRNPADRIIEEDKYLDLGSEKELEEQFPPITRQSLKDRFLKYMTEEKPYLNPELSIEDVAAALSSNRTYVSTMMNESFGVSFRTYINNMRIETAKELLLHRPDDILDSIAADSGFASSSQMIKKFSEIVGDSPRNWLKNQIQ